MKKRATFILLFIITASFAQNDAVFNRLQAINNYDFTFYNIDGYTITSQTFNYTFTEKNLKKIYRKYSIDKKEIKIKDTQLPYSNYYVHTDDHITDTIVQNSSFYFIEDKEKRITIIQFSAINKRNKEFEHTIIESIIENRIPKENFASLTIDSINFAGRKIKLKTPCNWTQVNTIQCPYNGEMNWSVHKELQDAKNTVAQQFAITKSKKNIKILSEEIVDIEFEGITTPSKRVVYDLKGMTSLLASVSGGKTLTVYYVATGVRDNYISCVLSFWNNDTITENGLPYLLGKVMSLKK